MDYERVDSFPEYNLFFSPNWYSHQIVDVSSSGLCALGCNDEVQLLDLVTRRPITSLYIKQPQNDKYINDINERKVTAVSVSEKFIIFATVSGYLTIFEISDSNIICKFCDCVLTNVQISCIKELKPEECQLELLLTDNKNKIIFVKYNEGAIDQLNLERQGNNHATKYLDVINYGEDQFYAKIMDNGTFNIWTSYFEEAVYNVDIGHILNTASFGVFDGLMIISIITRKNRLVVCQVGLNKILDEFNKERNFVVTNGNNFRKLVDIELDVQTPFLPAKSLEKIKLRFHNRVVSLNDQRIIITSKDGNLYLTDIESLMKVKEEKLTLKPAAFEESENPFYEMLDENPHFKNIYFAKVINDSLVSIGMDRLASFWKISPHKVQYEFNIKCLGSKCTRVAFSPVEPQCYLLNCNDNTLRLWNTGKKTNRFVSTILWKGLDKRGIKEIAFHPDDEALICFVARRGIALMDIYAHTILSQFHIPELQDHDTMFHKWLPRFCVRAMVDKKMEYLFDRIFQENKNYKSLLNESKGGSKISSKFEVVNKKYKKEIDQNHSFFAFMQNKGYLVADFRIGTTLCTGYRMERFISATDIFYTKRKDTDVMLLLIGDKKGNLVHICVRGDNYDYLFHGELHTSLISVIKVNKMSEDGKSLRYATGSYDRFIKIFKIKNMDNFGKKNISHLISFKHKFRILEIDWDPFNEDRLLNICQKHATVQVWSISGKSPSVVKKKSGSAKKSKKSTDGHFVANIRGHKGFVTCAKFSGHEKDMIVTASDDQSVKIWDINTIKFNKPPNKKRNKATGNEEKTDTAKKPRLDNRW
jgi:WD40 repeat protein